MPQRRIDRHKTALFRSQLSRPFSVAYEDGLINSTKTVFDYGCGRGQDIKQLRKRKVKAIGWDPTFRPDENRTPADIVNLGYVVNVIEDPKERLDALRSSWELTRECLIVTARLKSDFRGAEASEYEDGCLTRTGTFQKFYDQSELRSWIDESLSVKSIPAAPGVFYVFREEAARQAFLASRYRRRVAAPRLRKSDVLFKKHRSLFDALMGFLTERGRLPSFEELEQAQDIIDAVGSLKQAFRVIQRVTEIKDWESILESRSQDLLVHLALSRFEGRPIFSGLPSSLQGDVKAFFGNYKRACKLADELLFSAGNLDLVTQASRKAPVGKMTPSSFYVHVSALGTLPPILRVYEGCARAYLGAVDYANIIKLSRVEPKVSYLTYSRVPQRGVRVGNG